MEGEVAGLLALMLLTDARRAARTEADGTLVPLTEQQRELWDAVQIEEGVALVSRTLGTQPIGPYQVQAAIAAVHDEAPSAEKTDWPQIVALSHVLEALSPGPVVTLNRAVAVAMVDGPHAGLALLETLDGVESMAQTHRLAAVRAHPARARRRHGRGPRLLPARGEDDRERRRAALPLAASGQARLPGAATFVVEPLPCLLPLRLANSA